MSVFTISGYYVSDNTRFDSYLVHEYHNVPKDLEEEDIFYFGLSEESIQHAILSGEPIDNEFVITSYELMFS